MLFQLRSKFCAITQQLGLTQIKAPSGGGGGEMFLLKFCVVKNAKSQIP